MKKFSAVLLACSIAPFTLFAEAVEHSVKSVSVFTDRAVITRAGTASLAAGKNEIEFPGIRDNIDLRSIRAGTEIPAGVEILGVSWERHVSQSVDNAKIAELESELEKLQDESSRLAEQKKALESQRRFVDNAIQDFSRSVTGSPIDGASVASRENDAVLLKKHIEENARQSYECENALRKVTNEISKRNEELNTLYGAGNARKSLTLIVTVKAEKAMKAEIPVAYTTRNARWVPHYDTHLDASAGTLNFAYDGMVYQNTGENWENVRLTLSTAQPQTSALPPKIRPIELTGKAQQDKQREIVVTQEAVPASPAVQPGRGGAASVPAENFSSVRTQGASVTFEISSAQNILSGNQAHGVSITEKRFEKIELNYEAAPQLRNGVYLRALAKNATEYPILAGKVGIYRNSGFIGESSLKYTPVGEEFAFFAGTIDGLSAAVEPITPYRGETNKFFSSASNSTAEGDIFTLANFTDKPCKIRLRAQIKVSEIDDVKISILKEPLEHVPATTPGYVLDNKTGLIYWDVEVPAGTEKKIFLTTETTRR